MLQKRSKLKKERCFFFVKGFLLGIIRHKIINILDKAQLYIMIFRVNPAIATAVANPNKNLEARNAGLLYVSQHLCRFLTSFIRYFPAILGCTDTTRYPLYQQELFQTLCVEIAYVKKLQSLNVVLCSISNSPPPSFEHFPIVWFGGNLVSM